MNGLGSYIMEDGQGRAHYIDSQIGGEGPAVGVGGRVNFGKTSEPTTMLDLRLEDWIAQAKTLQDLAAGLEAYANTYRPMAIGRAQIAVLDTIGETSGPITEPVPGGCYFVVEGVVISYVTGTNKEFTIQITRSAGNQDLFDEPMHVCAFDQSGSASGGYYALPRRMVLYPNETITFTLTNLAAALVACDLHLTGYLVAASAR